MLAYCMAVSRPSQWKTSHTALIYKKGDPSDPANWRPIALQCTIYKIFAATLACRLATFCNKHQIISPYQKGFMPVEGCFEHAFLARSLLDDSKRRNINLRFVWFNLQNAFGSVPHSTLLNMMSRLGIPKDFIDLCGSIYSGSHTLYKCSSGLTEAIQQRMGVKQGCPLSPLLFNLTIQGLLLGNDDLDGGYSFASGVKIRYLAYADDLCIVSHSKEDISSFIDCILEFTNWAGLPFRADKCAALSCINHTTRKYVESFSPGLNGDSIKPLKWAERYRYLGVPMERTRLQSLDQLKTLVISQVKAICASLLTDWQKIDMINTFVVSQVTYYLRAALPCKGWTQDLDSVLRKLVKKSLCLPRRTITSFLYVSHYHGVLGLFSISNNLVIA